MAVAGWVTCQLWLRPKAALGNLWIMSFLPGGGKRPSTDCADLHRLQTCCDFHALPLAGQSLPLSCGTDRNVYHSSGAENGKRPHQFPALRRACRSDRFTKGSPRHAGGSGRMRSPRMRGAYRSNRRTRGSPRHAGGSGRGPGRVVCGPLAPRRCSTSRQSTDSAEELNTPVLDWDARSPATGGRNNV